MLAISPGLEPLGGALWLQGDPWKPLGGGGGGQALIGGSQGYSPAGHWLEPQEWPIRVCCRNDIWPCSRAHVPLGMGVGGDGPNQGPALFTALNLD